MSKNAETLVLTGALMLAYVSRIMPSDEVFRTTMAFTEDLLAKIDDLLHEAKKRGEVPRNTHRNAYIVMLLEQRVNELMKAGSAKKRSTT
jgi:hypothetical protein